MPKHLAFHYKAGDEPLAIIPSGFVYQGVFHGNALDGALRWHRVALPLDEFCTLLGDPA